MDPITVFTRPAGTTVRCYNCGQAHQITVEVMFHYHDKRSARSIVPIALPCGHLNSVLVYRSDNPEQTWPAPYDPSLELEPGFEAYQGDYWKATGGPGEYWGEVMAINLADAKRQFEERFKQQQNYDGLALLCANLLTIKIHQY
jgi:hypothetical protein